LQHAFGLPRQIAIESSTRYASLALSAGGKILRYIPLDRQSRPAATITVALAELLVQAREQSEEPIRVVAVTDGPGSFTGLRVGVTTAKTLAYALGCKLVAVDSLACMVSILFVANPDAKAVTVALNAYRGQLFIATWTRDQWQITNDCTGDFSTQSRVVDEADWIAIVQSSSSGHVLGAEPSIATKFDPGRVVEVVPTAIEVALLGDVIARHGIFVTPMELLPRYLRESAAEEKQKQK